MANAETIDSLLVSLGLDVDRKSFQKATDAINDIKSKSLQLLAAAGVGLGFDAWTRGVSKYVGELNSLSRATLDSTRKIEGFRSAFGAIGGLEEADIVLSKMADIQRKMAAGDYSMAAFIPGLAGMEGRTAIETFEYIAREIQTLDRGMQVRALTALGARPGSSAEQFLMGEKNFSKLFAEAGVRVTGISPELNEDVDKFNGEMNRLRDNFNELSKAMGKELIPPVNEILSIANNFIKAHPDLIKAGIEIVGLLAGLKTAAFLVRGLSASLLALTGPLSVLIAALYPAQTVGQEEEETELKRLQRQNWERNNPGVPFPGDRMLGHLSLAPGASASDFMTGDDVPQFAQSASVSRKNAPEHLMPEFTRASQKHGVPVDVLLGMAKQESGFNPLAMGPQTKWGRAQGIMQYLSGTAASLGIDPLDPSQAIDAAAKQIRERLDMGESIEEAIAHHHAGPNRALWGPKTADYVEKVTGHAAGFRGIEDAMEFSQGAFSSPSQTLPGSNYSPSTQEFNQTNHITIESTGNQNEDQRITKNHIRNLADAVRSDVY